MRCYGLLTLAVLAVAACGGSASDPYGTSPPPPPPAPPPPPPGPPPPPSGSANIDVEDSQYDPATVNLTRGGTVTWTWRGGLGHSVTFEDNVGSAPVQSSGTLDRTFANAGTYRFRCTVHSTSFTAGMVGSVVVQ
jgi:hypothetical protein